MNRKKMAPGFLLMDLLKYKCHVEVTLDQANYTKLVYGKCLKISYTKESAKMVYSNSADSEQLF